MMPAGKLPNHEIRHKEKETFQPDTANQPGCQRQAKIIQHGKQYEKAINIQLAFRRIHRIVTDEVVHEPL